MTAPFETTHRVYDLIYRDKDYAAEAAQLAFLLRAHAPGATDLLELGCGSGRHALCLSELGYHVTGVDRSQGMLELARANGLDYEILSPAELRDRYPLIETHDLLGALWDPLDGDIDPSQLTQALAREARALGATIRRHTRVTALQQKPNSEWIVTTDKGEIHCEIVVNAAGYRAAEVMKMVGRHMPLAVMSHQYLVTEDSEELLARGAARLPLLRDPDTS